MTDKPNNYDYTSAERQKRRRERIKELGLKEARLVCHPDDKQVLTELAESLLKKRNIELTP